ncbi:MAG: class I SAM-dependent methyltransferase [Nitrospirae bacterium]|nr:class I SAM-dependent methyltransferase [Nitrospirota bacterium]
MPCVCPSWLSFILYNPVRKIFTDRQNVLDACNITAESVVLEIGAGNGFFTESIAERAKKVIAVELQQGMVRKLRKRTARFGEKVTIITGDIADSVIQDATADVCLLYYSFHEIARKDKAARVIGRALKPGGSLAIYEPTIEVSGEDMQATLKYFIPCGFILERTARSGFTRYARLSKQVI